MGVASERDLTEFIDNGGCGCGCGGGGGGGEADLLVTATTARLDGSAAGTAGSPS
jgi:hypothetical protein